MTKRRGFPKIFFGWWIVITGGILNLWGYGYQAYGISALFKPIAAELGFNRAVTSVASSIGRFEGGVEAPITGWITDKFGAKWVVIFGVSLISLGLILMNYINSLWQYYVAWGFLVGTGVNMALGLPMDATISNWFVKKRGLAISVKWMFSGFSGVLILPLIAWLISTQGWRITCLIGGVVMAVVGLPLVFIFVKQRRPEYYGLLPDGAAVEEAGANTSQMIERGAKYAAEVKEGDFTLKEALRTPAFWVLTSSAAVVGMSGQIMNVHTIPFLTDQGIDPVKAAAMMSLYITASMPSRLAAGFIADRVGKERLAFLVGGTYLVMALGVGIYLLNQTILTIYLWFILYGLGFGAHLVIPTLLRARYFGRKAYGAIHGITTLCMTPIGVIAPIYAGWVYDTTGSYMTVFTLFAALNAAAAFIVLFARPPKTPAKITDIP